MKDETIKKVSAKLHPQTIKSLCKVKSHFHVSTYDKAIACLVEFYNSQRPLKGSVRDLRKFPKYEG